MKPYFHKAIRYFVTVTCKTPLRTGGTEGDGQQILRYGDGTPFLQGASLAGALQGWKKNNSLFGDSEKESQLIVSDLVFHSSDPLTRPRLRIDEEKGTADNGGKFDIAALPVGTTGKFQLIWRGGDDMAKQASTIESYLAAMEHGFITLGAQKSNGFGRVTLQVEKRTYDLCNEADRNAWLLGDQVKDARTITLQRPESQLAVFKVEAKVSHILVKASAPKDEEKKTVTVPIEENDAFVIPGSSLKGAIRAQMHRSKGFFAHAADLDDLLGRENKDGDNGIAGKVRVSDGKLENQKDVRINRIRIDRFTGGTMGRGLFTEKSISGTLNFEIQAPSDMEAGCGQLLYALRDLGLGLFELGSGTAVGRGRVDELLVEISADGKSAELRCKNGQVTLKDKQGLLESWQQALTGGCNG